MHAMVDREVYEHDDFVSPHSFHQHDIHTSKLCRVYLSLGLRPHFVSCQEFRVETSLVRCFSMVIFVNWHRVVPAPDLFKRK